MSRELSSAQKALLSRFKVWMSARAEARPDASLLPNRHCPSCRRTIQYCNNQMKTSMNTGFQPTCQDTRHKESLSELLKSASQGCHLCTHLLLSLVAEWKSSKDPESISQTFLRVKSHYNRVDLELYGIICLSAPDSGPPAITLLGHLNVSDDRTWGLLANIRENVDPSTTEGQAHFSSGTASMATFALAKQWFSACEQTHQTCLDTLSAAKNRPSRLLDVKNAGIDGTIRLRCTEYIEQPVNGSFVQYMTLSHRWSKNPVIRLTSENLAQFQESIALDNLPPSFQCAITVTQHFECRYLWIDSLCIIQDSLTDWQTESSIMGDIYQGGILNIAATSSPDSQNGFFSARNSLATRPIRLSSRYSIPSPVSNIPLSNPDGELLRRGWVVQERVLSPRTLFFNEGDFYIHRGGEIMWECGECTRGEWFPDNSMGAPNLATIEQWSNPKREYLQLMFAGPWNLSKPSENFRVFHNAWNKIVQRYSECELTVASDKLVALHGMVRIIEERTRMRSIAGLWEQMLPAELLWYALRNFKHEHPRYGTHQLYRAPSWSWASTDMPIQNDYISLCGGATHRLTWYMWIQSVDIQDRPNGQIVSGYLIIHAPLTKIDLSNFGGKIDDDRAAIPEMKITERGDEWRDESLQSYWRREARQFWQPDFVNLPKGDYFALLLARKTGLQPDGELMDECYYLNDMCNVGIVVRMIDGRDNVCERVGYFEEHFSMRETWPIFPVQDLASNRTLTVL